MGIFEKVLGGKKESLEKPEPEKAPDKNIAELKEQAMRILYLRYKGIIKEADKTQSRNIKEALAMLDDAEKIVEQLEELKRTKMPLIDDLEKIIEGERRGEQIITAKTPEGKEIKFEIKEQLEYWRKFYAEHGIDWIELPGEINVTEKQAKEVKRLIEELGFDKMIIAPARLAGDGKKYEQLHERMSEGYEETYQGDNFKADGGFEDLKNTSDKLRIIITKEVQNLEDDELLKETLSKSVDALEAGIFKEKKVRGIDAATYLVMQREYFERTKKHLDEIGWTWLTENRRPVSGRVPVADWQPGSRRLAFDSTTPSYRHVSLGCRLASSLPAGRQV